MLRSANLATSGSVHLDLLAQCSAVAAERSRVQLKSHDMLNLYLGVKGLHWFAVRIRSESAHVCRFVARWSTETPVRLNAGVLRQL